jgi:hypothetical protein
LVVLLFALAGMAALVALIAIAVPEFATWLEAKPESRNNRTWLTRQWTQTERSQADVESLAEILGDNAIAKVYLQMGAWNGQTGAYMELPYGLGFKNRLQTAQAGIEIYLWISIPPERLNDEAGRQEVLAYAERAVLEYGFGGVHIQARSVSNENEAFLQLLRDLRSRVGPQIVLSITVPPDRTPPDPSIPSSPVESGDLTWSADYKRRVMLNVDEIVLMAHASSLDDPQDYTAWLAYQVAEYGRLAQELQLPLDYIVALPTYAAELGHDPNVENVDTALAGIRQSGALNQVDGVGLYPWDETDLFELDAYWAGWVQGDLDER